MLNNLTNFFNLITGRRIKTALEPTDLIAVGTKQSKALGDYKPTAIQFSDLEKQLTSNVLETTLFAFPLNYVVVPIMEEDGDTITGPSFFFGNIVNLKSYTVSGTISVQTNVNLWYIGTLSADVVLNETIPWKVEGVVSAFDDSLLGGMWLQTGLSDGAKFSDTAGGNASTDYCTVVEDYNGTPGSIDLYLAVASLSAVGDIYGNVSFQYKFYVDESINLVFTN